MTPDPLTKTLSEVVPKAGPGLVVVADVVHVVEEQTPLDDERQPRLASGVLRQRHAAVHEQACGGVVAVVEVPDADTDAEEACADQAVELHLGEAARTAALVEIEGHA